MQTAGAGTPFRTFQSTSDFWSPDCDHVPFPVPAGTVAAVRVIASITHPLGGLRVNERARVLRDDGTAVEGLWAAGVDAGGVAVGGYASGLAQALVLGLVAAEDASNEG